MSEKELAQKLLDKVPKDKMEYVIAYLQEITSDEHEDDVFCEKLLEDYLSSSDEDKSTEYTLDECIKEWGLN
ncbi:MAG: hypothetical protein HFH14_01470 [Lachnospiraceae bacterium]|nr:hypothetical protein [Lachnospiraceae bacterium]